MTESRTSPRQAVRLRDLALGVLAGWLVVQNAVLLALLPWERLATLASHGQTLVRSLWRALPALWSLPFAFLIASLVMVHLVHGAAEAHSRDRALEVRHG
jgi:hypothetical protein